MTVAEWSNTHGAAASTRLVLHSKTRKNISLCLITVQVKLGFAVGFLTYLKKDGVKKSFSEMAVTF